MITLLFLLFFLLFCFTVYHVNKYAEYLQTIEFDEDLCEFKISSTPSDRPDSRLMKFWKNSFNFNGKTKRRDFWITQGLIFLLYLFSILISITLFLDRNYGLDYDYTYYQWTGLRPYILGSCYGFSIVTLIPSISLQVRRLRDAAKNPWWILISLIPFLGGIILLIFYLSPSREKRLPMTLQDRLSEVEDLLKKGTIDEEEYKYMRKKILSKHID